MRGYFGPFLVLVYTWTIQRCPMDLSSGLGLLARTWIGLATEPILFETNL